MSRLSDRQVLDMTNDVARIVLSAFGYEVPPGYRFYENTDHPRIRKAWSAAAEIIDLVCGSCVQTALANLGVEEKSARSGRSTHW